MTNAIDNVPTEELRKVLVSADDETLAKFMHGYSLGVGSDLFISVMVEPNQRVEFFVAMAAAYPDDWKAAVELLSKE